ncbi:MAG: ABC transporter permease [Lacunisphaera sp.]
MIADLRFAFRTLAKTPGFAAIAILTLALAIGVNSALFTLVHGTLLRQVIPVRPEQVVNLFTARQDASKDYRQFSHAEFMALRNAKDSFSEVAAMNPILAGIGSEETMRRSFAFEVSDNYFAMLGTTPAAGRFFSAEESRPGANIPVVIVSHPYWQAHGGRADFIGSRLRINGQIHTVIGVTRRGFSGTNALLAPDVWLPFGQHSNYAQTFADNPTLTDLASPKNFTLNLTARLAPGLTLESLKPRLPALAKQLDAVQPADLASARELQVEAPSRFSISTTPSGDGTGFPIAATLLGMSGCVLLIACLNLANMLLARGSARTREIAVRLALGATRGRIVRQLVVEGFLLALAGGALGLLVALWSNDLLLNSLQTLFSTMNFSLAVDSTPSAAVLLATFGFCLVATILFSIGPALRASKTDLVPALKQQGADTDANGRLNRFFAGRNLLVMAQISLSFMLLFSAALFVRGALAAGGARLGFTSQGQYIAELDYSLGNTPPAEAKRALFNVLDRLRTEPGVTAAALGNQLPYGNTTNMSRFVDARQAASERKADPNAPEPGTDALITSASDHYFEAMGVTLLRGRDFTASEVRDEKSPRVAIIDEALAKKLFPKDDALGQHIRYTQARPDGSPSDMEIVGLCAPHRHDALQKQDRPRVFVPFAQNFQPSAFLHIRTALAGDGVVATLRAALHRIDPAMPLLGLNPMTELVTHNIQLWIVRLGAALFAVFGGVALLLAVVGVYGVKSYTVARRTKELGIRLAIGAHPRDVFTLIMKQGVLQTALGLFVGLLLALGVGQLLGSFLYQVSPFDPLALGGAGFVLAAAALLACFLPARRATKVSPMVALRSE